MRLTVDKSDHNAWDVLSFHVLSIQGSRRKELSRFSQCWNAKTVFVNFWSVYCASRILYWTFMFQKILEEHFLNRFRLTAPLYILLTIDAHCTTDLKLMNEKCGNYIFYLIIKVFVRLICILTFCTDCALCRNAWKIQIILTWLANMHQIFCKFVVTFRMTREQSQI